MYQFFFTVKNNILKPYIAVLFQKDEEDNVETAEDKFTQNQNKSINNYKEDFYKKWGFLHNLYQITNKDIVQIDIWLKKPVFEFLNMVVYMVEFNKLEEIEAKRK